MKNFDWIAKEVYMVALLVCHCFNKGMPSLLSHVFLDFSLTVKAAPHECVIRTGQP